MGAGVTILIRILVLGFLAISLNACGGPETPKTKEKSALEKNLEPQLDAIQKAEELEDELLKNFEERDKKMRESGI